MSEFPLTNEESLPSDEVSKEYDQVIHLVFEKLLATGVDASRLSFTKSDIEHAADDLGLAIKNVPDIVYAPGCTCGLSGGALNVNTAVTSPGAPGTDRMSNPNAVSPCAQR